MNHFTPFIPARMRLADILTSDDSCRDLEERALEATRMKCRHQRIAEAVMLVTVSFYLAFALAV